MVEFVRALLQQAKKQLSQLYSNQNIKRGATPSLLIKERDFMKKKVVKVRFGRNAPKGYKEGEVVEISAKEFRELSDKKSNMHMLNGFYWVEEEKPKEKPKKKSKAKSKGDE